MGIIWGCNFFGKNYGDANFFPIFSKTHLTGYPEFKKSLWAGVGVRLNNKFLSSSIRKSGTDSSWRRANIPSSRRNSRLICAVFQLLRRFNLEVLRTSGIAMLRTSRQNFWVRHRLIWEVPRTRGLEVLMTSLLGHGVVLSPLLVYLGSLQDY